MENRDLRYLLIDASIRYWGDSTVNGIADTNGDLVPCRDGDRWQPKIDIQTGVITNWELGTVANINYKVCDEGKYFLTNSDGTRIMQGCGFYVPLCLGSYGDYIEMYVNADGSICDFKLNLDHFEY